MFRMFLLSLCCLLLSATLPAFADELETVAGEELTGTVAAISAQGEVTGEGLGRKVRLSELRSWQRKKMPDISPAKIVAEGHAGAKLQLESLLFDGNEFHTVSPSGLELTLPFDGLRALRFEPSASLAAFEEAFAKPAKDSDKIFLKVDKQIETIAGLLAGITATELSLDISGEKRKIPRERIYGIVFANAGGAPPPAALISLTDGSRIAVKSLELQANVWRIQLVGGTKGEIAGESVSRIDFCPPGLVFLSDLEPAVVKEEPLFTSPAPWRRDQSVAGNTLQVGVRKFEKGLGVHARSELSFDVPPESNWFLATIGIDEETRSESTNLQNPAGDCEFRLLADGRELFSARVKGGEPPQTLRLELRNVKRLTLLVEPGEDFDFADHADWCDARFLKLPK